MKITKILYLCLLGLGSVLAVLLSFLNPAASTSTVTVAATGSGELLQPLQVVTKRFEPFVIYENGEYSGFSIDLWNELAQEIGSDYQLRGVNTLSELLDEVKLEVTDAAIAGISITSEREAEMDFSHSYYESGLQIMVLDGDERLFAKTFQRAIAILSAPELYYAIATFLILLLVVAHIIWFSERRHNPEFPDRYLRGIWESFWWAAVTVTTVGYGDKTPKRLVGRLFGLFWMCAGYFVFAYFTATVATTFTVQELQDTISTPEDLNGKRVATIAGSTAAEYLSEQDTAVFGYEDKEKVYQALSDRQVDAVVYDAPALQYYASHEGKGKVKVVGSIFQRQNYGIALPMGSPARKKINAALLTLMEDGTYDRIHQHWFGKSRT